METINLYILDKGKYQVGFDFLMTKVPDPDRILTHLADDLHIDLFRNALNLSVSWYSFGLSNWKELSPQLMNLKYNASRIFVDGGITPSSIRKLLDALDEAVAEYLSIKKGTDRALILSVEISRMMEALLDSVIVYAMQVTRLQQARDHNIMLKQSNKFLKIMNEVITEIKESQN